MKSQLLAIHTPIGSYETKPIGFLFCVYEFKV
jgi:hypothetical protein